MDDDLDFSNDGLLRQLQSHKQEIANRLNECRDGLQSTVDQISHIEQKREIEKLNIEKEFEKTRLQILYILDKRKKELLKELDSEIDIKRELLLNRVKKYQTVIIEAADLQPEILKLEKYELNNNQHIITESIHSPPRKDSLTKIKINQFINENKEKFFPSSSSTKKKNVSPPRNKPPPPPSNNHNEDFMSVPSPSLHNLPIQIEQDNKHNDDNDDNNDNNDNFEDKKEDKDKREYTPTSLSKKRLMLEIEKFLFDKPPSPHKPRVEFICNRKKFIIDLECRFIKYGNIASSTGSLSLDLQDSINTGVNWMVNKTNPIVSFGTMIANGFKKKQQIKELKTIPPPLLIVYLNKIEKALAEEFAECLTIITHESGVIISVLDHNDNKAIQKWLDPASINATKIAMKYKQNENNKDDIIYHNKALNGPPVIENDIEAMHENDYAYNPDLESELSSLSRSVLRVCILLYNGETHSSLIIDNLVQKYENKYNLRSISGVEIQKVTDKPTNNISSDCPNCYIGNIFYDENDGIVEGQEAMFDSIAKCVFSPNSEFDDDEINIAIDAYDKKNNNNNNNNNYNNGNHHQSFQMM